MDPNKLPLEPRQLRISSGASKTISEATVHSTQTAQLSCVKITTISKRTRTCFHLSLDIYEYRRVCPKQFLSLWYVWRKPCTYIAPTLTLSPNETKQDSRRPTHLGVPSSASKTISETMVRSTQSTHLSCVRISTISKRTQTSFHLSLVT
jgi:hypothetical protein